MNPNENPIDNLLRDPLDEHRLKKRGPVWSGAPLGLTWGGGGYEGKKNSHWCEEWIKNAHRWWDQCWGPPKCLKIQHRCSALWLLSVQACFRRLLLELSRLHCTSKFAFVCVCLLIACLSGRRNKACPRTYVPLQLQGWHVITKTALSITLTDRLKRGFNSHSPPTSTPSPRPLSFNAAPSSPFIVSSCQSLGGLTKWPLLLLGSAAVFPLIPPARRQQEEPYCWAEGPVGVLLTGVAPQAQEEGAAEARRRGLLMTFSMGRSARRVVLMQLPR